MKKWNGLFQREWLLYRSWIWGVILATVVTIFLVPVGLMKMFDWDGIYVEIALVLTGLWVLLQSFIVLIQFCISLNQDAKRIDVWLHTPATTGQIISSKIAFSILFEIVVFIVLGVLGITLLVASHIAELGELILLGIHLLLLLVSNSLFMFVVVLLLWIFHMKMRHYTGKFTGFITVVVGIVSSLLWSKMLELAWMKKWLYTFEIKSTVVGKVVPKITDIPGTLEIQNLYLGSILFYAIVTILFYAIALKWFDRGVEQR
ncbi:hypothetical protein ABE042_11365 [Viridibacillus arvi]|uniref:Uncharacterized protein n=1 Tax=Viridibacillus arvi TaxID=263475 RepID=A0A0M0LBU1_9BACL|nr:hypothetical protein [Viridibacillus arvi]KOO48372.1 hypothetical protein AMD00_18430 [Viridibacillus arvi]